MPKKPKTRRTLEEILHSVSDSLYPEKMGKGGIEINDADCLGDTPLHVMTWREDIYAVKLLIEHGANINATGDMTETPLHIATRRGNLEIVEALLAAGARTDIMSEFGQTPKDYAKTRQLRTLYKKYETEKNKRQ